MLENKHPPTKLLCVEYLAPSELKPHPNNSRKHSKKQIDQLKSSISQFSFLVPILIDQCNIIIAGHARVIAAQQLGMQKVPVIRTEHLSDTLKRAYIIADNKLTENGEWDQLMLSQEIKYLAIETPDLDFSGIGFELPEIDIILQETNEDKPEEEHIIIDKDTPAVTKPGDLWKLGNHLILCGNALVAESYVILLQGKIVQLVFTDPPYNVPINGHVCAEGKHAEFAMASGEMSSDEFTEFLYTIFALLIQHSEDGSIHYVCMDWRHIPELIDAAQRTYDDFKNLCVWNKNNGGMGSLYRSKHELVFVFKKGDAPHINNIELGKHGRYRTNVWDYPGQSSVNAHGGEEPSLHPTMKPLELVADALLDCSHRGGLVLDPFGGSGTTLIAAEKTGRHARLIEIDRHYVDVTIKRWQHHTSQQAIHVQSGQTFDTISKLITQE